MDWSSISDTGFMVLAAGTAAVGALVSLASYYLYGRVDETKAEQPKEENKIPNDEQRPTTEEDEDFVVLSPEKKKKQQPSKPTSGTSSAATLQVPASGSAILVSPVKERVRPATRTLPSRGHHKARPAVDPQSTFHQTLLEQQQSQQHEEDAEREGGRTSAGPSASSATPSRTGASPAGRGRGAPMGIGGQGMNMNDLMAARARMRKADQ